MTASIKRVFTGRVIQVNIEHARMPDGSSLDLEIVRHPGGAAAVAIENGRVCLLRQFRHAADGWLWELPAGKLDPGEAPLRTAQRELAEEAGVEARNWRPLGRIISSPGVFTEVIHLFLADTLATTPQQTEPHEFLEVHWLPFEEAIARAQSGEITDAKTLVGLFRAQHALAGMPDKTETPA